MSFPPESNHCLAEPNLCLVEANHCLVEANHCLAEPNLCLVEASHCLVESSLCLAEANHCLVESNLCLAESSLCLLESADIPGLPVVRLHRPRLFRTRPVHGLGEPGDRRAETLAVGVGQPVQFARQQRAGALAVLLGQALGCRDHVARPWPTRSKMCVGPELRFIECRECQ
jgi:hypothetical protein